MHIMNIHHSRQSIHGTTGSVKSGANNLGIASGTTLRWHSADNRWHSEPRCWCAGWLLFSVQCWATGRLRRL